MHFFFSEFVDFAENQETVVPNVLKKTPIRGKLPGLSPYVHWQWGGAVSG